MTELELRKIVSALDDIAIVLRRMDNKLEKNARSGYGGADINYKEIRPIALYKRIVFDFPIVENVSMIGKKAVNSRSQNLRV